jgi:hypothetical protein
LTAFIAEMAAQARRHNLKTDFIYYAPETARRESWRWSYDIVALEPYVDQIWFPAWHDAGRFYFSLRGGLPDFGPSYSGQNIPRNLSYTFHGLPLSFWEGKRPIWADFEDSYTITAKGARLCFGKENFGKWVRLASAWQPGSSPAVVAAAINPIPFVMQYPYAPGIEYEKQVSSLVAGLTRFFDVDGLLSGSLAMAESLNRYRLVILPEDMTRGFNDTTAAAYRAYVENGGKLLVINSPVTTGRADLTAETDLTAALCGVRFRGKRLPAFLTLEPAAANGITVPSGKVWAAAADIEPAGAEVLVRRSEDREPALTRHRIGRGEVYFSAVAFGNEGVLPGYFAAIIAAATTPPVTLAANTGIGIRETVGKAGAAAITLWGQGTATLHLDAAALGLGGAGPFEVRDIITGTVLVPDADAARLAAGIPVVVQYPDQPVVLAVGAPAGLAQFTGIVPGAEVFAAVDQEVERSIENPEVPVIVPEGTGLKVGVYYNGMAAPMLSRALERAGFRVFSLPRLDLPSLRQADVVVVPQLRGNALPFNQAIDDLRGFVENGGGILFTHDAVGYRKHKAAFPEIGKGFLNPRSVEILDTLTIAAAHPVTAGFATGDTFVHAFYDHVALETGPQGQVLMTDQRDLPAVIAGVHGKGRVILSGMLTGHASKERGGFASEDREPDGGELQFLLAAVRWLGADE